MSGRAWLLLTLAACDPNVGNASESVGTGETSSSDPTTTTVTTTATASTTSEPDPTTSSEASGDTSSSSADTTTGETCVPVPSSVSSARASRATRSSRARPERANSRRIEAQGRRIAGVEGRMDELVQVTTHSITRQLDLGLRVDSIEKRVEALESR